MILVATLIALVVVIALVVLWLFQCEGSDPSWW